METRENPRGWEFELRRTSGHCTNFRTSAAAHAALGKIAGRDGLNLHIHEGAWSDAAYSTAYKGNDYFLGAVAVVTTYRGH